MSDIEDIPDEIFEEYFDCNASTYRIVHAILSCDCLPLRGNVDNGWEMTRKKIVEESHGIYMDGIRIGAWSYSKDDLPSFEESYRMIRKYPQVWQWCNHQKCALA